jgi:putative addiction module component (TIGR02574 family)
MSTLLPPLEQPARALAPDERARLAEVLLESPRATPPPEIETEWQREIEKRVAAYDRGETQVYVAQEVLATARRLGT